MFSSLRSRLWLSYALLVVTALSVVAIILFIYLIRNPFLYRQTLEKMQAVQTVVTERDGQSISTAAEHASNTFGVRILLFSADQQLLLDTYANRDSELPFPRQKIIPRNIPIARDAKKTAWLYTLEKLPDNSYIMVAAPRPRVPLTNVFTDDFLPLIIQSGVFALLLSLVAAFFFARWIADPLQKVVQAARQMPSAEIKPVEPQGPHEVQELTRAFNGMILRTQASQKSQRDFVANVSHEMKTPLTSIQGFAQAILDGTADGEASRQQAAQVIYDESARMHRMVLDLLDLARLDAGTADIKMSSVNIHALLLAVAEKFSPQSQRAGVEIIVEQMNSLPALKADGDRLAQVFTNLIDNALKFTPRGGRVSLGAGLVKDGVQISVSDTGAGIPEAAQPHIFDRFYQADPARGGGEKHGAGLGLAIARELIQAHDGRISVRSSPGSGTSFDVFLPL